MVRGTIKILSDCMDEKTRQRYLKEIQEWPEEKRFLIEYGMQVGKAVSACKGPGGFELA
jgi:hypothetical protein